MRPLSSCPGWRCRLWRRWRSRPWVRRAERLVSALGRSESVSLLTGFRGNGKSTELLRLKKLLEESGSTVFLVNMLDYLLMTKPVELSDFILSLMAALSHAVSEDNDLNLQPLVD